MQILCEPLGYYAPNTRLKSTSCYIIKKGEKILILDMGIGIRSKLIDYIIYNKIELNNITIVISHNHFDHIASLSSFGDFLLKYHPKGKINLYISDTSEKYYDWYKNVVKKYNSVFNIVIINEDLTFYFSDLKVSFCKTNHCEDKIKSFATKISGDNNSFVYTSDIASVDSKLKKFVKNANIVMVDAGNPIKRLKTLSGYHGITKENVYEILDSCVDNVYLTHLKACFNKTDYLDSLYRYSKEYVDIITKDTTFNIFTGKRVYSEYFKQQNVLMA